MQNLDRLINVYEFALNQEYTGKAFFETALSRLSVGAAVDAFKKLIQEEEKHIRFISSILERLREGKELRVEELREVVGEVPNYFVDRATKERLDSTVLDSMIPDVTVFNTAWLIEKDLSDFYRRMAERSDGEVRGAFRLLSEWEKVHEEFFREYRDRLQKMYEGLPWGG
ncbi:ferritin family protein [Thermodesulforhabdus norvegica]|uniref:Rubrerythrin n=1 Tax=Thermodesulforhabdus norvegica TaxID=39841 RepID=A0A1I4VTT9_9BACT|nr:ferritin family protein [Thermodesulforhabdus norvegica]SFN04426.1 Rubrerythrin [Thermodesulforhabdus norvegica]